MQNNKNTVWRHRNILALSGIRTHIPNALYRGATAITIFPVGGSNFDIYIETFSCSYQIHEALNLLVLWKLTHPNTLRKLNTLYFQVFITDPVSLMVPL
jgi:hypothetical protein